MEPQKPPQKSKRVLKFNNVLFTTLFIVMPGVILQTVSDYVKGGFDMYFFRTFSIFIVVGIALLLYGTGFIKKSSMLATSVYTIVVGMMLTLIWAVKDPQFNFQLFFTKIEVIVSLLLFAVGMLVHFRHIISLIVINLIFIGAYMIIYPEIPIPEYGFFAVIVTGGGTMAYVCQKILIKLSRKVKEANKLIASQNIKLREMNQSKDDLFRIIGHDLRTPFYQLKSLIDLVDEVENEFEKKKIKDMIRESATKGHQLLEDLLEWGNMYKEKPQTAQFQAQKIATIVDKVFQFSDFKCKSKDIDLINELPEGLKIHVNPTMMETVFRNLIANAIKFSLRGSRIVVKSERKDDHIVIAVEDQGVGMCDDKLIALFSTERNQSTTGTENEQGTGFGLNIAKKLVEKQNGTFEIESQLDKGTTINMCFPKSACA